MASASHCHFKIFRTSKCVSLEMRGMNDEEKSFTRERHFKVSESRSESGLLHWRLHCSETKRQASSSNLGNSSLEKHIDPALVECVQFKVLSWKGLECGDGVSSQ